ncbi:MAG: CAP domain-containing protein [Thaumarchaeota archaeon]|nr:CAP domain-containing protein [Nitrososphaerota archaeon]MDG6904206.1 CAP domain-containing protein [Nitrososphaerota archaeon]MDG6923755.1 CAP domain-containing protein [Nitrososphaerota archaeon]
METPKKSHAGSISFLVVILIVVVLLLYLSPNFSLRNFFSPKQSTSTFVQNPSGGSANVTSHVEITYPSNYAELANYSLTIINQNRTSQGLSPVILSTIPSGQQHADSMLQNNYFSHWDIQGFKPYMRYSLLNGTGFVEENVAYEYAGVPRFTSTQSVENAINSLEWQMMNNDSACCSNGHRNNILNVFHNRVSIGIAYSSTYVYFVEDFETYLADLSTPISQGGTVTLQGNTSQTLSPSSVEIYFDATPTSITPAVLNSVYDTPYNSGTFLGGVVPPCNSIFGYCQRFTQGITIQASTWEVKTSAIDIQFSLANFINNSGAGVYTVYLTQGSTTTPEYLTSISVFVSG